MYDEDFSMIQSKVQFYFLALSPLNRYPRPYSSDMNNTRRNPYQRPYNEPNWYFMFTEYSIETLFFCCCKGMQRIMIKHFTKRFVDEWIKTDGIHIIIRMQVIFKEHILLLHQLL